MSAVNLSAARDCGRLSDCSLAEQHPMNAEDLSDGCTTITDSSSPSERRRGQKRDTATSTAVPVGARSERRAVDCNIAVNSGYPCSTKNKKIRGSALRCFERNVCFPLFFLSADSYPRDS